MRTGRDLIIATKRYAEDFTAQSWWCIISTIVLGLLALAGTHWNFHPVAKILCGILSGLLILRLFVIYHDQQHHAILPRSRLAEGLMQVVGILTLSPSSIWRSSHNHHHNHNSKLRGSHIGSYPIMTKEQFLRSSTATRRQYLYMRHPLTILSGYFIVFLYGMCINPFLSDPKKHFDCLIALVVHLAISVALVHFWGWPGLILTQTIPHLVASALGAYLFYAQHNFPGVVFNDKAGWTYEKAAMESSSFLKTNRVMTWFTANIGYHHIHHLNARIPFYRLPEAYREVPELQVVKTTSLHPLEILRCLRLKVWDVEAQRMISLRQLFRSPATGPDLSPVGQPHSKTTTA